MRVLFVIPGDGEGSSMIFARRQAAALRAQGVEVAEFFLRSRTSLMKIAGEFFRFRRELARIDPEIVHAHYGTVTAMFARLAAGGRRLVITYRGSDLNPSPGSRAMRTALAHLFSQIAALGARRIICVSRQLRDRLWWRREGVTIMASGVDASEFQPGSRDTARRELGWRFTAPMVLFHCGRDAMVKRLDLASAAMAAARRTLPELDWQVLDGSTEPGKVPLLMKAADCLLVTSDYEGSPTVVQEALASNLPIVSVEVGDAPERLSGVSNTKIVTREAEAIGAAIVELTWEPRRSDGRQKIAEFDSETIAARLRALYAEAAG